MSDVLQGTQEWRELRLGKVTASRVADVVAKTRTGWGASRANYMAELIAERLTGTPAERYINGAMQWGIETEPEARENYELYRNVTVDLVGFVAHPSISSAGASPDGYVGQEGLVEIKCPSTKTHIDTLLGKAIEDEYVKQVQWQMACTQRLWCDWVSYDPRMPVEMQMVIRRVYRDDNLIAELESQVAVFLEELDQKLAALKSLYQKSDEAESYLPITAAG